MRRSLSIKRFILWSVAIFLLCAIVAIGVIVISAFTDFGQRPQGEHLQKIQRSPEWNGKQFENNHPMWKHTSAALFRALFDPNPNAAPASFSFSSPHVQFSKPPVTGLRITWLGHSSTVLEMDGVNVLIDPVWSDRVSPFSWLGPKRWHGPMLAMEDLPPIDVVLISHDHYDHLDHNTILKMKDWKAHFVVPLGLGQHLKYWGIPEARITELDWWQSTKIKQLDIVATPSRHASGRLRPIAMQHCGQDFRYMEINTAFTIQAIPDFFPNLRR